MLQNSLLLRCIDMQRTCTLLVQLRGFRTGHSRTYHSLIPGRSRSFRTSASITWTTEESLSNLSVEGGCKNLFDYLNEISSQISGRIRLFMDEVKRDFNRYHNFLGFFLHSKISKQCS